MVLSRAESATRGLFDAEMPEFHFVIEPETIVTADDLRNATWRPGYTANGNGFTVRTSECKINGATVRGQVQEWSDGRREVIYQVHGQNVTSLEAAAAVLSGRWVAGDDSKARDD